MLSPQKLWSEILAYAATYGLPSSISSKNYDDFLAELFNRLYQRIASLPAPPKREEIPRIIRKTVFDLLGESLRERRRPPIKKQTYTTSPLADLETREAVNYALSQMPPDLRRICEAVMYKSVNKAAKELGITRHKIMKALKEARVYFRRAGLP